MRIAVVGAGFSGAVVAREMAMAGHSVEVFDGRDHVAGNCHTCRDEKTGILIHRYGPHIFHTSDPAVWKYVNSFGEFLPFTNRVKSVSHGHIYSFPVNLHTINQFFGKRLTPREAEKFVSERARKTLVDHPRNFEEQALSMIGAELYEAFFKGYTEKQWGLPATQLPASILKRLPIRFNYDDNYYNSRFQGLPREGYTKVVERILNADGIKLTLGVHFTRGDAIAFDHVFYTGPLDAWFNYSLGMLGYRSLEFIRSDHVGDYQGNAVINYPDASVPFTRETEHRYFAPWEEHSQSVVFTEHSRSCEQGGEPYYPLRLADDKSLLSSYVDRANMESGVTFVGRLATYRYIDMHVAIAEALNVSRQCLQAFSERRPPPIFSVVP
jgi:UDP-galactopyranose mutase